MIGCAVGFCEPSSAPHLLFMVSRPPRTSHRLNDGQKNLSCLTAFPFDKIKIDKSFISTLMKLHKSSAIISSATLARGLDISVTAEGVETSEPFERLRMLESCPRLSARLPDAAVRASEGKFQSERDGAARQD